MLFGFGKRYRSRRKLTAQDFLALARDRPVKAVRARKIGFVAARQAAAAERVETLWNGTETTNTAAPGDWIATALSAARTPLRDGAGHLNRYVIAADRFGELYAPDDGAEAGEHGAVFRGTATVAALAFPDGLDIVAPWGERQRVARGYLIRNGDDIYAIDAEIFAATYEVLAD